jgi:hypothetical protein
MTPSAPRAICDEVGKPRLAEALGWTVRTIDRKLAGQHRITKADAVAIRAVVATRVATG